MLRNYGYDVIDLGKDVPADEIIAAAKEHNASIIVLSAFDDNNNDAYERYDCLKRKRAS